MHLIGLGALIQDDNDALAATQHLCPVNDLLEQRVIAGCRRQVGIIEGAAQAAGNALRLGGLRQVEGIKFGGNLRQDTRLGGEDAGDEQGQALAGGIGQVLRWGGGPDTLEHFLKHGARG
jgi:hypothetical protein